MRIDLNIAQLSGMERDDNTARKPGSKASSATSIEDTTSLSTDSVSLSSLETRVMAMPQLRQDKVDALRLAIQNGDYKMEPAKLAQAILGQDR